MKNRIVCISKDSFVVSFSRYDTDFSAILADVREFPWRRFDQEKRVWTVPFEKKASQALNLFAARWRFDVCNAALLKMASIWSMADPVDTHSFPAWEDRPEAEE